MLTVSHVYCGRLTVETTKLVQRTETKWNKTSENQIRRNNGNPSTIRLYFGRRSLNSTRQNGDVNVRIEMFTLSVFRPFPGLFFFPFLAPFRSRNSRRPTRRITLGRRYSSRAEPRPSRAGGRADDVVANYVFR